MSFACKQSCVLSWDNVRHVICMQVVVYHWHFFDFCPWLPCVMFWWVIMPPDKELQTCDSFRITSVTYDWINNIFVSIEQRCWSGSIGGAYERSDAAGMKLRDNVCHDMSAGDIVFCLLDYFIGPKKFRWEFAGSKRLWGLKWIPEKVISRLEFVVCRCCSCPLTAESLLVRWCYGSDDSKVAVKGNH